MGRWQPQGLFLADVSLLGCLPKYVEVKLVGPPLPSAPLPCVMAVLYFSVAPCMMPDNLGASPWGGTSALAQP